MKPRILLIDQNKSDQEAILSVLPKRDYALQTVSNGAEGLAYLQDHACDLILLDYSLPDLNGLHVLKKIVAKSPDIPVIMVTSSGSERLAVKALRNGASDYLVKSSDFVSTIPHMIRDNLDKFDMKRRNRELENQLRDSFKQMKTLNRELEEKVQQRTEELERAYQLSNELMAKAVDSNMQLAELYTEVDEARRQLDIKIRELSLLNDMGQTIASISDQTRLFQETIRAISQKLEMTHCAILLLEEEQQRVYIGASYGTPDDLLLASRSIDGQQILLEVIAEQSPVLVQDVEFDERFGELYRDFPGVECCMLIPMRVKDQVFGVLTVYGAETAATFTSDDLYFVSSLSSQTSIALANILLTQQHISDEQHYVLQKVGEYLLADMNYAPSIIREHARHISNEPCEPRQSQSISQGILDGIELVSGNAQHLLDVAQGATGELQRQNCVATDVVQNLIALLEPHFSTQKIHIHHQVDYNGVLSCDPRQIQRVFLNIAENARKMMPDGGTFTIRTQRAEDGMIHFEFIDDGIGIEPDILDALFTPFGEQTEDYRSNLGFAIVKKILDGHHAHLDVQSRVDKGTTVHILFPEPQ